MARKPSVYLDSCCLIDAVKYEVEASPKEREKDTWFVKAFLQAHKAGDIIVYTSTLSIVECVAIEPGQAQVPAEVQERFRRLLTSGQYIVLLQQTPRTWKIAQDIRWKHNLILGGADSIHIAAFLERNADEFVTLDGRLKSQKMQAVASALGSIGKRFCRASDTQVLPPEYLQGSML